MRHQRLKGQGLALVMSSLNTTHKWTQLTYLINPLTVNPFKPEFTFVIFIHYKPRVAVAILDL